MARAVSCVVLCLASWAIPGAGHLWLGRRDPFPPVEEALDEPNGLLAAGGDLSPERLLDAYARGIFPWFNDEDPVLAGVQRDLGPDARAALGQIDDVALEHLLLARYLEPRLQIGWQPPVRATILAPRDPRSHGHSFATGRRAPARVDQ